MICVVNSVLLATDSDQLFSLIDSAIASSDLQVYRVKDGAHVIDAVNRVEPELVILDLQIGNMGGVACSISLKQEMSTGRMNNCEVALLLDRDADEYIAGKSGADAWIIKPLDPMKIKSLVQNISINE